MADSVSIQKLVTDLKLQVYAGEAHLKKIKQ